MNNKTAERHTRQNARLLSVMKDNILLANEHECKGDNLPMINHIDEDKTNNLPENLEWCDNYYNLMYGHARQKQAKKIRGRKHTEEHNRKISEGIRRRFRSDGERKET